jgi:two-component system NtrC family sensor kinase
MASSVTREPVEQLVGDRRRPGGRPGSWAGASLGLKVTVATTLILAAILSLGAWLIWRQVVGVLNQAAPAGVAAAASGGMARTFLGIGAGALLVAAGAVYAAIRRFTRPLGELAQAARRFGDGQRVPLTHLRADGEVAVLADAFQRMFASLQGYHDTLEQRVEERSRQLAASQAQLLRAAKLASIGELAGGVAHELNNPAAVILMRAERLRQERGLSTEGDEDLDAIRRQVERISRIVTALLAFSRQAATCLQPTDANEALRRVTLLVEETLRSRGVRLQWELAERLPPVQADGSRLEQVLLNLINNAVDAMPDGGVIQLTTRAEPTSGPAVAVVIEVADTGTGIAAEHLPRIFDPFFTTKRVGQGTGLGLSLSYGIMQEHGGEITVDSLPGQGTRFGLRFPLRTLTPCIAPGEAS